MPAVAGVERALAHETMHAGFGAQPAVGVLARELDRGALDARDFARVRVDHFGGEAAGRAPAQVHAHEHLGPVLGFGAAGAGLDIHEGAVRIHLAVEHALQFELAHAGFEAVGVLLDVGGGGLVVLAFGELEQLGGVGDAFGGAVDLFELSGKLGAFAAELACSIGVLPDGRVFQLAGYFFEPFLLDVVLKETP